MMVTATEQITVLLVEDEELTRRVVRRSLENDGYRVMEAATCAEAEALWLREQPDVVVLDHRLPDRLGLDLLRSMRARGRHEKVIWLSGDTEVLSREGARNLDLLAVLTKPLDLAGLHQAVTMARY